MKKIQSTWLHDLYRTPWNDIPRLCKKGWEKPEQIVPGFHFPEVEAYDKAIEFIQARRNQEPPSHANGPELKDWYTRRGFTQEGE